MGMGRAQHKAMRLVFRPQIVHIVAFPSEEGGLITGVSGDVPMEAIMGIPR